MLLMTFWSLGFSWVHNLFPCIMSDNFPCIMSEQKISKAGLSCSSKLQQLMQTISLQLLVLALLLAEQIFT